MYSWDSQSKSWAWDSSLSFLLFLLEKQDFIENSWRAFFYCFHFKFHVL